MPASSPNRWELGTETPGLVQSESSFETLQKCATCMVLAMAARPLELLTVVSSAGPALRCTFLALGKQAWLQTPGTAPVPAALHASLAPNQLRCKVFGLFAFWIMFIDVRIPILRCVVDMCKPKCTLSLVWGAFFSIGFTVAFFFLPLCVRQNVILNWE